MLEIIYIIIGMIGLWIGSELVIKGALSISKSFNLSKMFIGLTLLAFITDLPELFVTISGSIHILKGVETSGIILGDIIGSCFAQFILIVGVLGLFGKLTITKKQLYREGAMLLGSLILLFIIGFDGKISVSEGILFIVIYLLYIYHLYKRKNLQEEIRDQSKLPLSKSILYLIIGFVVLLISANLTVENAFSLSDRLKISQTFIGILMLGLGTSLPELAVSLTALRKKAPSMAIGNLIGSNIFDILFVLGIGASISTFKISKGLLFFDLPILFTFSLITLILFRRNMSINKKESLILIGLYIFYASLKVKQIFF